MKRAKHRKRRVKQEMPSSFWRLLNYGLPAAKPTGSLTYEEWAQRMGQDYTAADTMAKMLSETNDILDDMLTREPKRQRRKKRKQKPPVFPFMLR